MPSSRVRMAEPYTLNRMGSAPSAKGLAHALIIGDGDRLGQKLLLALRRADFEVSAMGLDAAAFTDGASSLPGGVTDPDSVRLALLEVDAVVIALRATAELVHLHAVEHVVAGTSRAGVQLILVTQVSVAAAQASLERLEALRWQARGEQALRDGPLGYTIVRVGELTDEPGGRRRLSLEQGPPRAGTISRADVAQTCAEALLSTKPLCTTFDLYEADGPPLVDWEQAFSALVPDKYRDQTP